MARNLPDLTLRSTFIVGFPGETEEDFQVLLDWLAEARLDRVGCFKYSPVEGAAANELPDPVPEEVKQERYERFMELATLISAEKLAAKVGRRIRVLVDVVGEDGAIARSSADAPEIDGTVKIFKPGRLKAGDWADVEITGADAYDLTARMPAGSETPACRAPAAPAASRTDWSTNACPEIQRDHRHHRAAASRGGARPDAGQRAVGRRDRRARQSPRRGDPRARRSPALRAAARPSRPRRAGRAHRARETVARYYESQQFRAKWRDPARLDLLIASLSELTNDGLDPADYHVEALQALRTRLRREKTLPPEEHAGLELLATDALILGLSHLYLGKVNPQPLSSQWNFDRRPVDRERGFEQLTRALDSGQIRETFDRARPQHVWYQRGRERLKEYRALAAAGGWPTLPDGPTLKPA